MKKSPSVSQNIQYPTFKDSICCRRRQPFFSRVVVGLARVQGLNRKPTPPQFPPVANPGNPTPSSVLEWLSVGIGIPTSCPGNSPLPAMLRSLRPAYCQDRSLPFSRPSPAVTKSHNPQQASGSLVETYPLPEVAPHLTSSTEYPWHPIPSHQTFLTWTRP